MYKKIKSVLLNAALTCASLLFVFIILEFIVFRFFLPASGWLIDNAN